MTNTLAEDKFGTGAEIGNLTLYKVKRFFRDTPIMASVPFNWAVGLPQKPTLSIKNQYTSGSCWGQAYSRALEIVKGTPEFSAKSAYSPVCATGGGVNLTSATKLALEIGAVPESEVPSTEVVNGTVDAPEVFMEDTTWRNPQAMKDALTRAGYVINYVNPDIESAAQAIRDYGCVMIVIVGQNNGTWLSATPVAPTSNQNVWGHYMCSKSDILPVTTGPKELQFYQSWGVNVGNAGIQNITEDYFNSGWILDVMYLTKFQFTNDLSVGVGAFVASEDVKQLQRILGVEMTGYYGILTQTAVKNYQTLHNIPNTGVCGPLTRAQLNKDINS